MSTLTEYHVTSHYKQYPDQPVVRSWHADDVAHVLEQINDAGDFTDETVTAVTPAPADETVYSITREDLDEFAERTLTDDEAASFVEWFPSTSVADCIYGCLDSVGDQYGWADDEDEVDPTPVHQWQVTTPAAVYEGADQ